MSEQEFLDQIEKRTGYSFDNSDKMFGMIMGRMLPFDEIQGFYAVNNNYNLVVWKKNHGQLTETEIEFTSSQDAVNKICEFLNK